jgi:SAM-dependent methyltransferase
MHLNSGLLFKKYAPSFFKENMKVLEIGPASFPSPYQTLIGNKSIQWDTIDFASSDYIDPSAINNLTYQLKSLYEFPFADNSYDIVISGQVLEHVEKIWVWMKELKRITKPGGHIITINPVSWPYHEAPIDCWRAFPSGIKALASEVGLDVDLCLFESLEEADILRKDPKAVVIPGRSYKYFVSPKKIDIIIRWNKSIRRVPKFRNYLQIPIEAAFDTISILKK